ncbi:MAG: homoserine O-acetyltransferase/O-succinyltransferase family protein [Hyphomicrobiales bacterium]
MTIYVPPGLPAAEILRGRGHAICDAPVMNCFNHPSLRIALINLMPDKATTERHFAGVLSDTPALVDLVLVRPESYAPTTTDVDHLKRFYCTWDEVNLAPIDGVIITGAPVETMPFEDVAYWDELSEIFDDIRARQIPLLAICWAAQAALFHHHRVPKHALKQKAFGVFPQQVFRHGAPIVQGLSPQFSCPVSRHTETRWQDVLQVRDLHVAAAGKDTGLCLVEEVSNNVHYMFNHLEYGQNTLAREYWRDVKLGKEIAQPKNVFRDRAAREPVQQSWQDAAARLYGNWVGGLKSSQELMSHHA